MKCFGLCAVAALGFILTGCVGTMLHQQTTLPDKTVVVLDLKRATVFQKQDIDASGAGISVKEKTQSDPITQALLDRLDAKNGTTK